VELKFRLRFLKGTNVVGEIVGVDRKLEHFRIDDLADKIIETEQYLERLTGIRVHIEQVN